MRKGVVPGTYAFRKDIFPVSRDEMRSIELALVWPVEHAAEVRTIHIFLLSSVGRARGC